MLITPSQLALAVFSCVLRRLAFRSGVGISPIVCSLRPCGGDGEPTRRTGSGGGGSEATLTPLPFLVGLTVRSAVVPYHTTLPADRTL